MAIGQPGEVSSAKRMTASTRWRTDTAVFVPPDKGALRRLGLICAFGSCDSTPGRAPGRAEPVRRLPATMLKTRQQNVTSATWSPNGDALGTVDLTEDANNPFGANVFSPAVQKERLAKDVFEKLQATLEHGEALDTSLADAVAEAMKEWALERGATHFTHVFQPLTGLTAEKHDSFFEPDRDGQLARQVLRQGADPGRARRLLVPDRRRPRHLRGPRLHRLGPDQPRLHPREPERRAALHPDGVRLLDRRGARREDPAAALDGRALEVGDPRAEAARRRGREARLHHGRPRAGVLPDRRAVLLRAARPGH